MGNQQNFPLNSSLKSDKNSAIKKANGIEDNDR
jgi:hypothetical protein